jgi:membrane protease YdiL (CAAX protease family)
MQLFSLDGTPLLIGLIAYLLYFTFLKSTDVKTKVTKLFTSAKYSFYWIQLTRVIAFICMVILPVTYIHFMKIEFWSVIYKWTLTDTKYTLILALILVPLGAFNAKGTKHLTMYPQVRMTKWNAFEYLSNIASWGLYLLGYEFLFRGILFLGLIPFTGLYPAIAINTLLYTLAHLYKGKKETLGSIPLGIILCLITAETNTIWTAFAVHWIMAGNNFVWSHYYNKKTYSFSSKS